jgi:hypothetical protein
MGVDDVVGCSGTRWQHQQARWRRPASTWRRVGREIEPRVREHQPDIPRPPMAPASGLFLPPRLASALQFRRGVLQLLLRQIQFPLDLQHIVGARKSRASRPAIRRRRTQIYAGVVPLHPAARRQRKKCDLLARRGREKNVMGGMREETGWWGARRRRRGARGRQRR